MKQFACGDVVPGCSAVFSGEEDRAILGQVAQHASLDHGIGEVSDELVSAVVANIRVAA